MISRFSLRKFPAEYQYLFMNDNKAKKIILSLPPPPNHNTTSTEIMFDRKMDLTHNIAQPSHVQTIGVSNEHLLITRISAHNHSNSKLTI